VTSAPGQVRSRWILAAVSTALFCVQIDYFAMNLSLPRMATDLRSSTADLQWVISVYMLALGAFMVPAGRIGDIFGRRRALLGGIALFGVASVFCAIAPSAAVVIAFRGVQVWAPPSSFRCRSASSPMPSRRGSRVTPSD
jgi:MFS family permease